MKLGHYVSWIFLFTSSNLPPLKFTNGHLNQNHMLPKYAEYATASCFIQDTSFNLTQSQVELIMQKDVQIIDCYYQLLDKQCSTWR